MVYGTIYIMYIMHTNCLALHKQAQVYLQGSGRSICGAFQRHGFEASGLCDTRCIEIRKHLGHHHYTCKTDVATCHKVSIHNHNLLIFFFFFQNLGPIWKVLCCFRMGVPVPLKAVNNIISEQIDWKKGITAEKKQITTSKGIL